MENMSFLTIRQFAKKYHMPERLTRTLCKHGTLPGINQGSRFYINASLALRRLDEMSMGATNDD